MKKLLLMVIPLALSACGSYGLQPKVDIGIDVGDAASSVVVTKTVTPATDKAPEKITWASGTAGVVTFNFRARPGSQAAYITGWKTVSDIVDGEQMAATNPQSSENLNIYVPSGFSCAEQAGFGNTQSCNPTGVTTTPAEGKTAVPLTLNFAGRLPPFVIAANRSVYESVEIVFVGKSATGAPIEIRARPVQALGIKNGDQ